METLNITQVLTFYGINCKLTKLVLSTFYNTILTIEQSIYEQPS
jgi:hypothetical protein